MYITVNSLLKWYMFGSFYNVEATDITDGLLCG